MPVIVLVADGARADALRGRLQALPTLARFQAEGSFHEVTSVFPSVTGPAYTPFLMGRFPGPVGLPGLRWYDRARTDCGWPGHARSYVGWQMGRVDSDLARDSPTVFELVPDSLAAMSVVTRGLPRDRQIGGLTPRLAARAAMTHFSGSAERWLAIDRDVGDEVVRRVRDERPAFVFAALTGVDKASHARGHADPMVHDALVIVDDVARRLREDAERAGTWDRTHLWIVSDHGHGPVAAHDDLAGAVAAFGPRTIAHPFTVALAPDVAVMVSGNAMAHLYVDLRGRVRRWWTSLAGRWSPLVEMLLARPSVDVVLLPHGPHRCEVRHRTRGSSWVERDGDTLRYRRASGDALGYRADLVGTADALHAATLETEYPDAVVQILALAGSARAGDIILSAAPGHDFRARYEPIPHRSAHGALHREHMLVPLLCSHPTARRPRRTTDVFASALDVLGIAPPPVMDGASFM
ncbi:MAG: type phosphodiesterase/nucleotide pyrophosphatase [Gemmatimonadetes bacterium]|nr:type phosphodiesterase/nucleotide pyrophosphatase [Gemmatimonadota bacterium]